MKRITIITFYLIGIIAQVFAQQAVVPNGSFEEWFNHSTYGFLPVRWYGTNLKDYDFISVTRESDNPVDGTYYVKMEAKQKSFFGTTYKAPGGITLSDLYFATGIDFFREGRPKAGVRFTSRPTRLTGHYKYKSVSGDSYYMSIALTKWRGSHRDTIGFAERNSSQSVNQWTYFELPIQYRSSENPDTLNIILLTSPVFSEADLAKVKVGSILEVDKLEFVMSDYFLVDFTTTGAPCTGGSLTFTASSENVAAQSWEWRVDNVLVGTSQSLVHSFPEVAAPTNFMVLLRGVSEILGDHTTSKTITIHPKPDIKLLPENPIICPKTPLTLTASGGVSYQWNVMGASGDQFTQIPPFGFTYEVIGTDQYGCKNSASSRPFFHDLDTTRITAEFCQNSTYDFHGTLLNSPGIYSKNLTSVRTGCDSTIILTLKEITLPPVTTR
jgi:hypothetical protein